MKFFNLAHCVLLLSFWPLFGSYWQKKIKVTRPHSILPTQTALKESIIQQQASHNTAEKKYTETDIEIRSIQKAADLGFYIPIQTHEKRAAGLFLKKNLPKNSVIIAGHGTAMININGTVLFRILKPEEMVSAINVETEELLSTIGGERGKHVKGKEKKHIQMGIEALKKNSEDIVSAITNLENLILLAKNTLAQSEIEKLEKMILSYRKALVKNNQEISRLQKELGGLDVQQGQKNKEIERPKAKQLGFDLKIQSLEELEKLKFVGPENKNYNPQRVPEDGYIKEQSGSSAVSKNDMEEGFIYRNEYGDWVKFDEQFYVRPNKKISKPDVYTVNPFQKVDEATLQRLKRNIVKTSDTKKVIIQENQMKYGFQYTFEEKGIYNLRTIIYPDAEYIWAPDQTNAF